MFEKLERSWALVKASAAVLQAEKKLLVFPALSALCTLLVAASFLLQASAAGLFRHIDHGHLTADRLPLWFVFYLVQYFIIIFFNCALVGAALIRLRGGMPTLADGLRCAIAQLPSILIYALISATVGMILRSLQERAGFIGRWIVGLIGMAWSLATFLVVPILVSNDVYPLEAIKRSAELLKRTWGENLVGNAGIGVVFGLIMFLLIVCGMALIVPAAASKSALTLGVVVAFLIVAVVMLALVQSALQGIYAAVVYRYAAEGTTGAGFDESLIADAFAAKTDDGVFRIRG